MNDQYCGIEAWADGIYHDLEYDYAKELIEDHGVTRESVKDYRELRSSQGYKDCPIEQSLLETLEDIFDDPFEYEYEV